MEIVQIPEIVKKSTDRSRQLHEAMKCYTFPAGIKVDPVAVQDDVMNYGLFVHGNKIYCRVVAGKRQNETTGESENTYYFQAISNFSIEILQHMEDEKIPMKLLRQRNVHGKTRVYECPSTATLARGEFKKTVEGKGNYHFTGTDAQFELLKAYLYDKMGDGRMITVMGWQPEGIFVLNNGAIDSNGQKIDFDKYGSFEFDGTTYYVPSANHIYKLSTKFMPQKRTIMIQNDINFQAWTNQMRAVHREHSFMTICHAIACSMSDVIYAKHGMFPMMYLYGEASTGKGNLIQAMQTIFGRPQEPMTIMGKANTDKAKIRKFAQLTNMLVFLEEYRNAASTDTIEMLKGLWNRYGYERGNLDSAVATDTVPINSGVIITGNDYPNNDALLTRLIIDELTKNSFNQEEKAAYKTLSNMMERGYSGILLELYQFRISFEKNYGTFYEAASAEIHRALNNTPGIVERMQQNLSVLLAVFDFFSAPGRLQFSFTRAELINYMTLAMQRQALKRDSEGEAQRFWDSIMAAQRKNMVSHGREYKVDGQTLYINISMCYAAYAQEHYTLFRSPACAKSTIMDKLKKSAAYQGHKDSIRMGEQIKTSAAMFDLNKMEQSMVNVLVPEIGAG